MTVEAQTPRKAYTYSGTGTPYPVTFTFIDDADLGVIHTSSTGVNTTLTLTTQYTVTGGGGSTGAITVLDAALDTGAGAKLTIYSSLDIEQQTDLVDGAAFLPSVLEIQFDRNVRVMQQMQEELDRSVKVDVTSDTDPADLIDTLVQAASDAEVAKTASEAAQLAAETAQGLAEDAQVAAEAARDEAESIVGGGHNTLADRDATDCHPQSAITGLTDALAGKAASSHTHTISQITDYEGGASEQQAQQINFNTLVGFLNMELVSSDLPHGRIWTFQSDELATKTNATYNASGDYYYNPGDPILIDRTSGTIIGDMTARGGVAAAFDGVTTQTYNVGSSKTGETAFLGKNWGSDVEKTITQAKVFSSSDLGFASSGGVSPNTTGTIYIEESSDGVSWSVIGSSAWTTTTPQTLTIPTTPSGNKQYHRMRMVAASSTSLYCAEVQFYESGTPANMTLIPTAIVADAQPSDIDVYFVHKAIDTVTMGTDCKLAASRDGGTTWVGLGDAESAYTEVASLPDGSKIWKKSHDMTSADAGSVVTMGLLTDNNKEQRLHAFLMIWGG